MMNLRRRQLTDLKVKFIQTPMGMVEYTDYGTGEPVLFFHGGHSNCLDRLPHLGFDPLTYRLITPSRPGYGKTSLKNNESPEATAHLFARFLDQLGIQQTIVYGTSAGGPSAITFAALYKDRVKKVILASAVSTKWLEKNDKTYRVAEVLFHPHLQWLVWALVYVIARDAPKALAKLFFSQFSTVKRHEITYRESVRLRDAMLHYRSGHGFLNDIKQVFNDGLISRVSCPTLILHSKFDRNVPIKHAIHANDHIPSANLRLIENPWGHMIWIDSNRHTVKKQIEDFLNDHYVQNLSHYKHIIK